MLSITFSSMKTSKDVVSVNAPSDLVSYTLSSEAKICIYSSKKIGYYRISGSFCSIFLKSGNFWPPKRQMISGHRRPNQPHQLTNEGPPPQSPVSGLRRETGITVPSSGCWEGVWSVQKLNEAIKPICPPAVRPREIGIVWPSINIIGLNFERVWDAFSAL